MKIIKKLLLCALTILLAVNLTACSNKGSDNTAEPEKPAEMTELQEPVETQAEKEARENLEKGKACWYGTGTDGYDMDKAEELIEKSAEAGNAEAWYWLGELTRYRTDKDRWTKVIDCFNKAVELGSGWGYYGLGTLYYFGTGFDKNFAKAKECFEKAVDNDCLAGNIGLGKFYKNNKNTEADGLKAIEYLEKALKSDDWVTVNEARVELGTLYFYGAPSVEVDKEKCEEWMVKAAEDNYGDGYHGLGTLYDQTLDADKTDNAKSYEYYVKAAEHGFPYNLGVATEYGIGTQADINKAVELYKSQENGGREACESLASLAVCYFQGDGVEASVDMAREYAHKALDAATEAETGNEDQGYGVGLARLVLSYTGE